MIRWFGLLFMCVTLFAACGGIENLFGGEGLQVKPAKFPAEKSTSFCIYDAGGAEAGTIMIRQKGNPDYFVDDVPLWGLDGQLAFSNAMAGLRDFYVQLSALENGWSMQGILTSIIKILDEALPYLEEKRNDSFTDANSVLFTSRDVARVIQAYSYCNLTEYARAGELLEEVIGNGFYKLLDSSSIDYRDNEECILGIIPERNNIQNYNGECYPCIDYTEVLLTAAECYYCLGDRSRADGYINTVCKAKGLTVDLSEPLKGIAEIRLALQLPNYMTYLRRNSLSDLASATG